MYVMAQPRPSNFDLLAEILELKSEFHQHLQISKETRDLARKTNGRVTILELWKANLEGRDSALSKGTSKDVSTKEMFDFAKQVSIKLLALLGAALGIATALITWLSK